MAKPTFRDLPAFIALTLSSVPSIVLGQGQATSPQEFAQSYEGAIRSQNLTRLEALYHPATLACINQSTRAYFDGVFGDELRLGATLGTSFQVSNVRQVRGKPLLGPLPADQFYYPVQPTLQIEIEAKDRNSSPVIFLHYLARLNGRWYTISPCPNSRGMKALASQKLEAQRELDAGARLEARVPPGLLRELKQLVSRGQFGMAQDRYRRATGANLPTSMLLINAIREGR